MEEGNREFEDLVHDTYDADGEGTLEHFTEAFDHASPSRDELQLFFRRYLEGVKVSSVLYEAILISVYDQMLHGVWMKIMRSEARAPVDSTQIVSWVFPEETKTLELAKGRAAEPLFEEVQT